MDFELGDWSMNQVRQLSGEGRIRPSDPTSSARTGFGGEGSQLFSTTSDVPFLWACAYGGKLNATCCWGQIAGRNDRAPPGTCVGLSRLGTRFENLRKLNKESEKGVPKGGVTGWRTDLLPVFLSVISSWLFPGSWKEPCLLDSLPIRALARGDGAKSQRRAGLFIQPVPHNTWISHFCEHFRGAFHF